ncbi:MAG: M24 family metallopeptidase [Candidatus Methylomirabilia bacterium]
MTSPDGNVPREEIERRQERCRWELAGVAPAAGGLLVCSRLNIYYLTGTYGAGVLWLPLEGNAVLLCRRGIERARLESPLASILSFRSFRDLPGLLAAAGSPLAATAAVEMGGITWALGRTLAAHLAPVQLVPGDRALSLARAVKSPWELAIIRAAGADHDRCLRERLPALIAPGMSEREIAHRVWEVLFSEGHQGLLRMENYGEEVFLGHVSAGESGNYPSVFNGPVGLRGEHPATPHMGSSKVWERGEPLVCDIGFVRSGYHTDKTQVYFAGPRAAIPERVAAAHGFCTEVQAWLAERLRPGSVPSELAEHCFAWAEREGWAEGFMALGGNKVRFLGHGIGLAIDEYPVIAKGFDAPLEEGMTLALEPKLGIPGFGMVGVENTFEVTRDGGRCLSGDTFEIICVDG